MKKQWILIGTTLTVLALLLVAGCQNANAGVTVPATATVTEGASEGLIQPITHDKPTPQTSNSVITYTIPGYDFQPVFEGFCPCYPVEDGSWSCPPLPKGFLLEGYTDISKTPESERNDAFNVPDDLIHEGFPLLWDNPWH